MTFKICRTCKKEKPESFYHSAGRKNGKKYKRKVCKDCYSVTKKLYRDKKKEWYSVLKKNLACKKCGYSKLTHPDTFSPKAMQFHHENKDKDFDVSGAIYMGYSRERIVQEINKCTALCSRCHTEEHDKLN